MQDLKVVLTEVKGNEVIIRTGEALPQKAPIPISLSGTIHSPAEFAGHRLDLIDVKASHVVADYTNRTITLVINETSPYADKITGSLKTFPDLESLGINKNKTYTEKELLQKLNFFGMYFPSREEFTALKNKLMQFKAKITRDFTNADDYKGNSAIEKITKIEHEIPLYFTLNIPVFSGMDAKTFSVDIMVSARDGGISFWLESVELNELEVKTAQQIFQTELGKLSRFVIIEKW